MLGLADASPTIQAIVSALLGIGAVGWVFWQVLSRIKIEDKRNEFDKEQRDTREDLRKRVRELESILEKTAGAGAVVMELQAQRCELLKQINEIRAAYERRIQELTAEVKLIEGAVDEAEAKVENYRLMLAQAKFFLDGCKGCQHVEMLHMLKRELPKYISVDKSGDPLMLVNCDPE